ncbi:MAG: TIR domain-containing protein [Oscillospiraceae bacterium]|nr:TIR domain-containing protein [Oscillospiraceae bacterium]
MSLFSTIMKCALTPDKHLEYNHYPTLLVGLGGLGSRVVDGICSQLDPLEGFYGRLSCTDEAERPVEFTPTVLAFAIDADTHALQSLPHIPKQDRISLARLRHPGELFEALPKTKNWFPNRQQLLYRFMNEGASSVRSISRLSYELSLLEQRFDSLLAGACTLAASCVEHECPMRVSIVTSLTGGTGSGIFIQLALLIREHLLKHYPSVVVKIHGELILPSTFAAILPVSGPAKCRMDANAYAAMKELNAINEHFFNNTAAVELDYGYEHTGEQPSYVEFLPYDYCFLYDQPEFGKDFLGTPIRDAIIARLFDPSANAVNEEFVTKLRTSARKHAGNLYGTFYKELRCGIELSKLKPFKFGSGEYYTSYHSVIDRMLQTVTPHLHKDWHKELQDIGAEASPVETAFSTSYEMDINRSAAPSPSVPKIPPEDFVFISYSSREIEVANQIKHILETNGVPCWMAPQSIPGGSDYGNEIPKAIDKCKAFLLLLSDASQNSNWVPKEIGLAIGKGKIIVPFQIDNSAITDAFNFYLTNSQRISAYNRMTEAYQELLHRLVAILTQA